MIDYNKLVRDNIPKIIEDSGRQCEIEILNKSKTLQYLNKKLQEELDEYLENEDIIELADLEEVIHAILEVKGISYEELESIRIAKEKKNGGFKKGILLKKVY